MERTKYTWIHGRTGLLFVVFSLVLTSIQGHVLEFTVEPRDTVVVSGSSAVLDCAATSSEFPKQKIMIQWNDQDQQPVTFMGDMYRSQLTNGSLYISSVIEDQGLTGSYQCQAVLPNGWSIVSRKAAVTLASLSGFQEEPQDITVFPSQKAFFACRVQATPPPRVRWLKDERPLLLDEVRMTILPSGALEIDEVQLSDQGTYRCNASGLNQYNLSKKATLFINNDLEQRSSTSAPHFIAMPKSREVVEGQTITLDCAANGNPKPLINWLKDGVPIDMADLDSRFSKLATSSLQITNIQESDSGTYQCRAENREDSLDETANIQVQVPPRFHKKPEDKIATLNTDIEFQCNIYGKPEPKIQWLKNGEVINYNEYLYLVNGHNLKITGLIESDTGIFQCVGSNSAGNVQASARLKVIGPGQNKQNRKKQRNNNPQFSFMKKPGKSFSQGILESLKPESSHKLNIGKSDFAHSTNSKEYTINDGNTNYKINTHHILTSLISDDLGDTLSAYTESPSKPLYGLDLDGMGIQDGLPGQPQDIKAANIKARFVTLSWKPPDINSGEIITYSVYYREEGSQRERVQNTTRSRLEEANIGGLMPDKIYLFRVVAYNLLGPGPSSEVLKVSTQPEEHVPSSPLLIQGHATSPTSIHISWKPPEITNGDILLYKVYYMDSDTSLEHSIDTIGLSYDLIGLNIFTEYNIWIVAVNNNGAGSSSKDITVKTFSAAPSEPPQNITIEPGTSTSLVVRWEPPPVEGRNGIITGYKIRYRKQGHKGDTITTAGNSRIHSLINLERKSIYQIRLCAINVNGSGPPTEWITAKTDENGHDESVVPEEPSPLQVKTSSDSIQVFWLPPENQNIKVRKYILGWGKGIPDNFAQELDEKTRSYVISNLEPNSEYVISLRASNNIGPGPARYANVRTRDEIPPEPLIPLMPPVGLKAQVINSNSVVLDWTDTTLPKSPYNQDSRYYVVQYTSTSNPKERTHNSTDLKCVINDLKPNTQYDFRVKVVKGRRESKWSMVVQNTTFPSAPSTAPRDLTVIPFSENSQIVKLRWSPPKMSNGAITGYIIFYTTDNSKRDRDWLVHGVRGDEHVTEINNLGPTTTYFFKIQARNTKGVGPFSPTVSFRTGLSNGPTSYERGYAKDGKNGLLSGNLLLYIIIITIIMLTVFVIITTIICCRRRDNNTTPDRSKKAYQKGMSKQNIKPPDLWIHHDQMELKQLDKHSGNDGASSSGAMTLPRSVGANEYDAHEPQPSNSLDKRTYVPSYMGVSNEDKTRRVIKPKPVIMLPVESKPPREPIATATPINTTPINQSAVPTDMTTGMPVARPPYPRTQYTISRAHVTIDQTAMSAMVNNQPENPYATQSAYDSINSTNNYASQQAIQAHPPQSSTYAPGMNIMPEPQGSSKRLQGHPLKSFSVPAPPPTSAPGTPQPKHVVSPQITVRPNSSPYKKPPGSGSSGGTPTSRISASNPPPHTAEEVQRLAPSYSTEELNQEMANLEGLMKDLNAITASEFQC